MKKVFIILIIILTMCLSLTGCFAKEIDVRAVITLKSDAIVELIVDERGRVASIAPINAPAEVALIDLDIINDTVSIAMKKLVIRFSDLGYINAINSDLYVDTMTQSDKKTQQINRAIFNSIKSVDKNINILSYDFKIEERNYRSFVRNTKGYENLELLQYRMISNILRYRNDITYKMGARMSLEDLTQELIERYNFTSQFHTRQLAEWFSDNINAIKLNNAKEIAEVLGGVFKQYFLSFNNLSELTNKIIAEKLTNEVPLQDVKQALNFIGIYDDAEIQKAYAKMSENQLGYPNIKSLELYIDNIYINKVFANETVRDNYEKQIDMSKSLYSINLIQLTDKEKQDIINTLPINIAYQFNNNLNNIEDVYYLLKILTEKLQKDFDLQYSQATQELKLQIDTLVNNIKNAETNLIEEHKQLIDKEYERLLIEYKARLEIYKK